MEDWALLFIFIFICVVGSIGAFGHWRKCAMKKHHEGFIQYEGFGGGGGSGGGGGHGGGGGGGGHGGGGGGGGHGGYGGGGHGGHGHGGHGYGGRGYYYGGGGGSDWGWGWTYPWGWGWGWYAPVVLSPALAISCISDADCESNVCNNGFCIY